MGRNKRGREIWFVRLRRYANLSMSALAHSGRAGMVVRCPLSDVKRTSGSQVLPTRCDRMKPMAHSDRRSIHQPPIFWIGIALGLEKPLKAFKIMKRVN